MIGLCRDLAEIVRVSGLRGLCRLLEHSRNLKRVGTPFATMHCLIALEEAELLAPLQSPAGLDLNALNRLDGAAVAATCEYLYERGVLVRTGPSRYRVCDRRHFDRLSDAMPACLAYHAPFNVLSRLMRGDARYGEQVSRDDKYDALASATLTSIFSYGFARQALASREVATLLDCGCGTGQFLSFLRRNGFEGPLLGLDLAPEAIEEGRALGVESDGVTLAVGDALRLDVALSALGSPRVDVFSFMFVLHEFEQGAIETVLRTIRHCCPAAGVLLVELERRTSDDAKRAGRTILPELKLVHSISRQILRSADEWKALFAAFGLAARFERTNRLTDQISIFFEPA